MSRSSVTPDPGRPSSPRPSCPTPAWSTASAKVDDGTTVTDFDEEEIARKHTLSPAWPTRSGTRPKINLIDTPGIGNFLSDARAALQVADAALVVVDAVSGVMVQTEKVWDAADELGLPRMVVLNRIDRERASLERLAAVAASVVQPRRHPDPAPDRRGEGVPRASSISISKKAFVFQTDESGKFTEGAVPADMTAAVDAAREALIEMVAEADEKLMEKFFEAGTLTDDELVAGLRSATAAGRCSRSCARRRPLNIGVQPLLDAIVAYLPSPAERPFKGLDKAGADVVRAARRESRRRRSSGRRSPIRSPAASRCSASSRARSRPTPTVHNKTKDAPERLGHLMLLQGKTQTTVPRSRPATSAPSRS